MDKKYRFGTCFKAVLVAVFCVVAAFCADAAVDTNKWNSATGGEWNVPSNWSLGHVPTAAERVEFPDFDGGNYTVNIIGTESAGAIFIDYRKVSGRCPTVTFTGGGTLNVEASLENYIRENRKLVLDNVTVNLNKHYIMIYGLLELKNNALLYNSKATQLWRGAPSVTVGAGCKMECVGDLVNMLESQITVNGGEFTCGVVRSDSTSVKPINVTVNGGVFSVRSGTFSNNPTISMSEGVFKVESTATFPSGATFNFTGGTLVLPASNPPLELVENKGGARIEYVYNTDSTTQSTILENLNGETLIVNSSSDYALNLWPFNGYDVNGVYFPGKKVTVDGTLVVTNGYVNFNREGYFFSDYPIFAKGFKIQDSDASKQTYGTPTIGFPEIIIGKDYPFVCKDEKTGVYNKFYIEGPTKISAFADTDEPSGTEELVFVSGDLTVDTSDYYDNTVKRVVRLDNICAKDCASLAVTGGGELKFSQAYSGSPFTRVVVGANTKLTLDKLVSNVAYGPLHADEIVLEAGSVLTIPVGFNSVHAAKWIVDPTAKINLVFEEGLTAEAKGVLYDFAKKHTVQESQISLMGVTDNWRLSSGDGAWIVVNDLADTSPVTAEWTGNGADNDNKIVTPENWYGITRVLDDYVYSFGAGNKKTEIALCNIYADMTTDKASASTVQSFVFRNTATNSFKILGKSSFTLNRTGAYGSAGAFSESTVPHYFECPLRVLSLHSFCAAAEGPLVFNGTFPTKFNDAEHDADHKMSLVGDIRFGNNKAIGAKVFFDTRKDEYASRSIGSRLTVLAGGNVTFTNQNIKQTVPYSGFCVEEGALLKFEKGTDNAIFEWSSKGSAARHTVDGTMDIGIPFIGGNDQSFSGIGTLTLDSLVPASYDSILSFGGSLTVNLPAQWPTVTASAPGVPLTLKAYGTPVIMTEGDWEYGMFDEIASPAEQSKRAAEITRNATLTFNPNGGAVTFKDPLSGKGTVAIGNGTLYIPGGVAPSIGVKVCDKGKYKYDAAHELRSLVCEEGSTLRFAAPITVKERVNLDNVSLEWAEGAAPVRAKAWKTLFVSKSGFYGELSSIGSRYYARVAETANGFEYQVRPKIGAVVTFR